MSRNLDMEAVNVKHNVWLWSLVKHTTARFIICWAHEALHRHAFVHWIVPRETIVPHTASNKAPLEVPVWATRFFDCHLRCSTGSCFKHNECTDGTHLSWACRCCGGGRNPCRVHMFSLAGRCISFLSDVFLGYIAYFLAILYIFVFTGRYISHSSFSLSSLFFLFSFLRWQV